MLCQAFDFGPEQWQLDVHAWITKYLWSLKPSRRGETILAYDAANNAPVGFANWRHRNVELPLGEEGVIAVEWVGITRDYQGEKTDEGPSIARRLLETVERRARQDGASTPDMPLYLEVDARNEHAEERYRHLGFVRADSVEVLERGRYRRMVRAAVGS